MAEDRPAWARRIYNERQARGWSQADAIRAMRAHSEKELPGNASLLRQYKRWEAGEITPNLNPPMILKAGSRSPRSDPRYSFQEAALTRCSRQQRQSGR